MFNLTNYRPSVFATCLASLSFVACTADVGPAPAGEPAGATALLNGDGALDTYIGDEWIEIDNLSCPPTFTSGDANLFAGTDDDPCMGGLNPNLPAGGTPPYIDWNELVDDGMGGVDLDALLNHRVLDDMGGSKDASAFPQANSCVGEASVLDKMDLTYAAVANNDEYAYIAVQRAKNNGDAAYYWVFSLLEPTFDPSAAMSCASGLDLNFHITGGGGPGAGDVLVRGLFAPSASEPALEVFRANTTATVPAVDVINIEYMVGGTPLWVPFADDDVVVAVNTTPTPAGHLGHADVVSATGDTLGEHIIAEAAVPLTAFNTEGFHCGATYWATVLSRPSHSPTSDPKDYIGPFEVNFGELLAEAILTPTCSDEVGFAVTATFNDEELPVNCSWSFGSTDCSGETTFPADGELHSATVTITDPISGCDATVDTNEVRVYPDLTIDATGTNECTGTGFTVCATTEGGSGGNTYAWNVPGATIPAVLCPMHVAAEDGAYTGSVTVTDDRGCTANDPVSVSGFSPIGGTLSAVDELCTNDTVTYALSGITGGNLDYDIDWVGCTPSMDGLTCVVNPDDNLFCTTGGVSVSIGDSSEVCVDSEHAGTYEKVTSYTLGCDGGPC